MNIDSKVKEAAAVFIGAGKQVYLVGGAVRDLLRGRKAKDWDLATDARPEEVIALFQKKPYPSFVIPTGIKHGTVTVHFKGLSMEVTTFRSESGYSDGRRPDSVEFGVSIEEDLSRRDFTMNAAAWRLPSGPLVDPFDGKGDIKRRFIRTVGRPEERFSEDGLRPVRALRFASELGFAVDEALLSAIPAAIPFTAKVAAERIRDELDRIIASGKPSTALLLMEKTGLLKLLIPELAACRGVKQDRIHGCGFHRFDVLDHSLLACDFAARHSSSDKQVSPGQFTQTAICLAALFHDIGKPVTAQIDEGGMRTFYRHEKESAALAGNILRRFRYPNMVTDTVCHLIEEHMFHYEENWTDAAVRRFVVRVGEENLAGLFALRRADAYGLAGKEPPPDFLSPLQRRIEDTFKQGSALSLKDLALTGKDLIAVGIAPGKHMGIILSELLEAVLDDPSLNTREKLLEIAVQISKRYE
ncbi:MAG: CCA tRNA nucleotidyltransferase [Treponema sp.]|nr:CCA tRNA nucleotidyltransferase [Treponema sp.]